MLKALQDLLKTEISKGGFTVLIARMIGLLFFLLFNLMISNHFGAAVYGDFIIFTMLLNIGGLVFIFGLDWFALQKFPGQLKNNKAISPGLDKKIQGLLLIGVLLAALSFFVVSFIYPDLFQKPILFSLLSVIICPFIIFRYRVECIRATKDMLSYGILAFAVIPISALILFFVLKTHFQEIAGVLAYSFAIFIAAIFVLIKWNRKSVLKSDKVKSNFSTKQIINQSLPFMMIALLMFLNEWTDKLLLRILSDSTEVGLYSAAFRLVQLAALPLISINAIAAPRFAEKFSENNKNQLKTLVTNTTHLVLIVSIPVILFLSIFSKPLLSLFGEEFAVAQVPLLILMLGQMINVFAGPVGILLKMTENQNALVFIVLISLMANIFLNLLLIPSLGLTGAAIATAFSLGLTNIVALFYIKRKLGFYTFQINK